MRTRSRPVQISLGCAALIVLCICGTIVFNVTSSGQAPPGNAASRSSTATAATHRSAGLTATAIRAGQKSGPAVLGGTGSEFIYRYGPLTSQCDTSRGDLHFRQYPGVAQDFLIVNLGIYLGIAPGDQNAAVILASAPPGHSWTVSQANAACAVFFPSDARRIKSAPTTDPSGTINGVDVIYHSDVLVHVFPASAFLDASQNPTTPGSYDVMYLYPAGSSGDQIDSCSIGLGTQQT
jgi:hypothetical protein